MESLDEADRAADEHGANRGVYDYSGMARAKVRRTAPRARQTASARIGRPGDLLGLVLGVQIALLTFVALLAPRRG